MLVNQRTIQKPVSLSGIGLHTGNPSTITFHPAPEHSGFTFIRTDLENSPEIPALVDYVTDISRGTTLTYNGASVHTVEHVLAALVGLEIDNCRIELTANEPPVGDGSALPYTEILHHAGFVEQKAAKDYLIIDQTIRYVNEQKGSEIVALPNDEFRITVMIDYQNSALGSQHSGLFDVQKEFLKEFAPARTFCFLTEVEMLHNQGLIRGGSLDNAVVIVDKDMNNDELKQLLHTCGIEQNAVLGHNGILNNTMLRFKNEPARHKLLDMLGDLALIGVPIKGQILAARPGHASNIEFAKYYAGISYFRMNDFNKSVEYLKDFSTSAKQVQAIAYGTIGDAYSELKNTDEALNYYKKAGGHFPDDEAISSEYLYRAASLLELNGKADEAVEIFKEIKSKYPKSEKGLMADKFINKLKVQP